MRLRPAWSPPERLGPGAAPWSGSRTSPSHGSRWDRRLPRVAGVPHPPRCPFPLVCRTDRRPPSCRTAVASPGVPPCSARVCGSTGAWYGSRLQRHPHRPTGDRPIAAFAGPGGNEKAPPAILPAPAVCPDVIGLKGKPGRVDATASWPLQQLIARAAELGLITAGHAEVLTLTRIQGVNLTGVARARGCSFQATRQGHVRAERALGLDAA